MENPSLLARISAKFFVCSENIKAPLRKALDGSNPGQRRFVVSAMVMSVVLLATYTVVRYPRWDFGVKLQEANNFVPKDYPMDEHLPTGFDKKSCRSRFESVWYRRGLLKKPSPDLILRLRRYESLHKKCGPGTDSYKKAVEAFKLGRSPTAPDCKYVVWLPQGGLGNRMITITSAFLYGLLTDRVLLVDREVDIPDLFCEPFPETSWLLPLDFPLLNHFRSFGQRSKESYGNRLRSNSVSNSTEQYIFAYLAGNADNWDRHFYCNQEQMHLQNTTWLVIKSDLYYATYLFLTPHFREELNNLFPDKESIFHLLGRYLFHPTNPSWDFITKYYRSNLSKADVKVGIQVRIFDHKHSHSKEVLEEIRSCTIKENILPRIGKYESSINETTRKHKTIAVLMTSLTSEYSKEVQKTYFKQSTVTGEQVSVYQPSHEEYQKTDKRGHNRKAWEEIYLLSLMDKLVTSSQSTFGYVAQGLGGLQPWILDMVRNEKVPDPPCKRGISMEPCFHSWRYFDCITKTEVDYASVVPYAKRCEDVSWGFKLVQPSNPP